MRNSVSFNPDDVALATGPVVLGVAEARAIAEALRAGEMVTNLEFDQIYPPDLQTLSRIHWTPLRIARRAAALLVRGPETRVLDVGSGAGKFCLVGALTSPATFVGIEQRPNLVDQSRRIANRLLVERAQYRQGDLADLDWSEFQGFYLFNPFYENIGEDIRIDRMVQFGRELYDRCVAVTREKLRALPPGVRVATYHGFGGDFPPGYQRIAMEAYYTGALEVWEKFES